jgi:hypothetical protein
MSANQRCDGMVALVTGSSRGWAERSPHGLPPRVAGKVSATRCYVARQPLSGPALCTVTSGWAT